MPEKKFYIVKLDKKINNSCYHILPTSWVKQHSTYLEVVILFPINYDVIKLNDIIRLEVHPDSSWPEHSAELKNATNSYEEAVKFLNMKRAKEEDKKRKALDQVFGATSTGASATDASVTGASSSAGTSTGDAKKVRFDNTNPLQTPNSVPEPVAPATGQSIFQTPFAPANTTQATHSLLDTPNVLIPSSTPNKQPNTPIFGSIQPIDIDSDDSSNDSKDGDTETNYKAVLMTVLGKLQETTNFIKSIVSEVDCDALIPNVQLSHGENEMNQTAQLDPKWTLKHPNPGPSLVELLPNRGVYINKEELDKIMNRSADSRTLVRKLLEAIFNEEAIRTCHLFKKSNLANKNLDDNARNTILDFVEKSQKDKDWEILPRQSIQNAMRPVQLKLRKHHKESNESSFLFQNQSHFGFPTYQQ